MMAAEDVIAPRLPAFLDAYPDIEFDLRIDDRFEDIVEAGLDAGLRLGENLHADMIAVRASGPWRSLIVGAPAYFERHEKPAHPRALTGHDCIRRRFARAGSIAGSWKRTAGALRRRDGAAHPRRSGG